MAEQSFARACAFILRLKVIFTNVPYVQPDDLRFDRTSRAGGPHPRLLRPSIRQLRDALDGRDTAGVQRAGRLLAEAVGTTADVADAVRLGQIAIDAVLLIRDDECPASLVDLLECGAQSLNGAATVEVVVERLLALWRSAADLLMAATEEPSPLPERIARHLATHLHADTRLGDLARQLGYSPSHVSALILQATGRRFIALRADLQLDRACALLRQGKSVKEAALAAGFHDPDYLGRIFRRRFGMTPSAWRLTGESDVLPSAPPVRARLRPRRR